mgnify:CR=1 FL=1
MNKSSFTIAILGFLFTSCFIAFLAGCEISSGDETVRNVAIRISGTYQNTEGIPARQSGLTTTSIAITQSGDQLDGVDNFGRLWSGSITQADERVAGFELQGATTDGLEVILTGTITVNGSNASLTGTWIEPVIRSSASAQAIVVALPTATPTPVETPTVTPTPTVVLTATPAP